MGWKCLIIFFYARSTLAARLNCHKLNDPNVRINSTERNKIRQNTANASLTAHSGWNNRLSASKARINYSRNVTPIHGAVTYLV